MTTPQLPSSCGRGHRSTRARQATPEGMALTGDACVDSMLLCVCAFRQTFSRDVAKEKGGPSRRPGPAECSRAGRSHESVGPAWRGPPYDGGSAEAELRNALGVYLGGGRRPACWRGARVGSRCRHAWRTRGAGRSGARAKPEDPFRPGDARAAQAARALRRRCGPRTRRRSVAKARGPGGCRGGAGNGGDGGGAGPRWDAAHMRRAGGAVGRGASACCRAASRGVPAMRWLGAAGADPRGDGTGTPSSTLSVVAAATVACSSCSSSTFARVHRDDDSAM